MLHKVSERRETYDTNHIVMVFGDDFQYTNAHKNYESLDFMIDYMNSHYQDKVYFQYSTPSNYIDAISKIKSKTWTTKSDDGFPYSDMYL